eukprot:Skav221966  [mRNA]  locus=scaffold195:859252:860499:- [translate_table: standard]
MGWMMPVIGHKTLWELCLPGSHNALTYDLSDMPATGDTIPSLGLLERDEFPFRNIRTKISEELIVKLSKCQRISVREQLQGGIRFMDFRVIYSRGRWVGVHGLETKHDARSYLEQICEWLREHPKEMVVLWLSGHGNEHHTGLEQYPNASADIKQRFFDEILGIFAGLVVDWAQTPLDRTAIRTLVERNQRVVLICSDWVEFTGSSTRALDAAQVLENHLPGSFDDPVVDPLREFCHLPGAGTKYHIVSLANSANPESVKRQLLRLALPFCDVRKISKGYSKFDRVPEMVEQPWRQDHCARFTNYHAQIVLDLVWSRCKLPQAIYIDMLTENGGIEIGDDREFGYVDTILAYNALRRPAEAAESFGTERRNWVAAMMHRQRRRPLCRWEDRPKGRSKGWPLVTCAPVPTLPPGPR